MDRRSLFPIVVLGLLLTVAGCQSGKRKAEVYKHWNSARASVQGSLAAERYKNGNLDDARKAVDEAIKLNPEDASFRVISARIHIERNQLEAADRELATGRKLDPKNAEIDYLSGIVYQRWQKPELSLDYYAMANEKAPGELPYLMARCEMLVNMNRLEEATVLLEHKLAFFEYSGPMRDMLGMLYLEAGRTADAVKMLEQATILAPDDTTIRERYVRALYRNGNYREALSQVGRLLPEDRYKDRADLYLLKGEAHIHLEQWRDARFALETALDKQPTLVPALLSLAKASLKMNDLDRTEICFRRAVAIQPENPQVHLGIGYMRLQQSRWDDAMKAFQKAASLDRTDPVALCMIGLTYEKSGKPDEAMSYYGKALQLSPTDPLAKQLLSRLK